MHDQLISSNWLSVYMSLWSFASTKDGAENSAFFNLYDARIKSKKTQLSISITSEIHLKRMNEIIPENKSKYYLCDKTLNTRVLT